MKLKLGKIIFISVLAGLSAAGCSTKLGPIDTTVSVKAVTRLAASGPDVLSEGWKGYYLYGDTLTYRVASFEDAVKGLFAKVSTEGETEPFAGEAVVRDSAWIQFLNLNQTPALLLIVHPEDSLYAWRQLDLVDGLAEMSFQVLFNRYQPGKTVRNRWNIVVPEAPAQSTHTHRINASLVLSDDPETIETSTEWVGYYYAVADADYRVESLENAMNHVLTSTGSGPSLTTGWNNAQNGKTEYVSFELPDAQAVTLILYNQTYGVFAYRYLKAGSDGEENLDFQLYRGGFYKEGDWTVYVPEQEEEPEPGK